MAGNRPFGDFLRSRRSREPGQGLRCDRQRRRTPGLKPLLQRRAAEIPPAAGLAEHLVAGCGHCDGVLELNEAAL
jgi:hypothetical protein